MQIIPIPSSPDSPIQHNNRRPVSRPTPSAGHRSSLVRSTPFQSPRRKCKIRIYTYAWIRREYRNRRMHCENLNPVFQVFVVVPSGGEWRIEMEVVKVKRELLEACLTCSICMKLLQDATTISECLHTCGFSFLSLFSSSSSSSSRLIFSVFSVAILVGLSRLLPSVVGFLVEIIGCVYRSSIRLVFVVFFYRKSRRWGWNSLISTDLMLALLLD